MHMHSQLLAFTGTSKPYGMHMHSQLLAFTGTSKPD